MELQTRQGRIPYGPEIRYYNAAKPPRRQAGIFTLLMYLLSKLFMIGKKYRIEKIGMEGLKPPYILLNNHMYFVDFYLNAIATFPHKVYNIATIDGYYRRPWLMEWIGCLCKRKFTTDHHLVTSVDTVLNKYRGVLSMYPEARYSPAGTTAILPESMGQLVKKMNVPVVVLLHHGNYLHTPFWNYRKPRKVPLYTTMTRVLSAEQVAQMSPEEIQARLSEALTYNEYTWQKEQGIRITEPYRAEGLHKILYQCPRCMTESRMASEGTRLFCTACGKSWEMDELGELHAAEGETEFSHIPDWFEWERANVRREVEEGRYHFSDTVEVYSLPSCMKFQNVGKATLTHGYDGFTVEGEYRGEPYRIHRAVAGMCGVHIEYDYCYVRPEDCIDISTDVDSLYCYPTKKNVVTKLSFATEELYRHKMAEREARRKARRAEKEALTPSL